MSLYVCESCFKPACVAGVGKLLVCSLCKSVRYCSKSCQRHAWKFEGHKAECGAFSSASRSADTASGVPGQFRRARKEFVRRITNNPCGDPKLFLLPLLFLHTPDARSPRENLVSFNFLWDARAPTKIVLQDVGVVNINQYYSGDNTKKSMKSRHVKSLLDKLTDGRSVGVHYTYQISSGTSNEATPGVPIMGFGALKRACWSAESKLRSFEYYKAIIDERFGSDLQVQKDISNL